MRLCHPLILIFTEFAFTVATFNKLQWDANNNPTLKITLGESTTAPDDAKNNSQKKGYHNTPQDHQKNNHQYKYTTPNGTKKKRKRKKGLFSFDFGKHSTSLQSSNSIALNLNNDTSYHPISDNYSTRQNKISRFIPRRLRTFSPISSNMQKQTFEIGNKKNILNTKPITRTNGHWSSIASSMVTRNTNNDHNNLCDEKKLSLTVDLSSAGRLLFVFLAVSASITNAIMGTLRLLGPLIVSRRVLVEIWNLLTDYLRGRYFRRAYSRLEVIILRYYELPAASRSLARAISHIVVLLALSSLIRWIIGSTTSASGMGLMHGFLWVGAVVVLGDIFSTCLSVWGGPLRIQAAMNPIRRVRLTDIATNPGNILQWLQEPDKWIRVISDNTRLRRSFQPSPLLFPTAWTPLRLFQIIAMAKILSTESNGSDQISKLMRIYLIQSGLRDEWLLVLFRERRWGLGVIVFITYFFSLSALLFQSSLTNWKMTTLFLPSVLASVISGYLNMIIFWNRLDNKKKMELLNGLPFITKRRSTSILKNTISSYELLCRI